MSSQRKKPNAIRVAFGRSLADIAALAGHCNKAILRWLMTWQRRVRMVLLTRTIILRETTR
jgi:hypothetical protein